MQTTKGDVAQLIVREEFEDILEQVHLKVLQKIRERGETWTPLYSWDHTNLHESINFQKVGFSAEQRVDLGVKAPDMHQVIEHVFGDMKRRLHARLQKESYKVTGRQCQVFAKNIFENEITAEGIAQNVVGLPLVYQMISTAKGLSFIYNNKMYVGTGGDWIPRFWR